MAIVVVSALALWAWLPVPASSQDESALRGKIERSRDRERALSGAVSRLDALLARTQREIAIVQGRLTEVQADLAIAEARLARTQARLRSERARLARLKVRLADGQALLAEQLVAAYKADEPDVVSLVVRAHDFADLIEQFELAKRVQERNGEIVDRVHEARNETHRQAVTLAKLEEERRATAEAVQRRRDALAAMRAALSERQATLSRVRAARAQALAGTRAGRVAAEKALSKLIAEREAAEREAAGGAGPGGPWAIPWPIVQCESGGQNLPPNSAGASGYYQILPSTWHGLGGSTPQAYQASKAEQDRLAAKLWAGGAGAHNWVCAGLV
jgi:septal ring factor EnvC (AmiA/AmiB activator)